MSMLHELRGLYGSKVALFSIIAYYREMPQYHTSSSNFYSPLTMEAATYSEHRRAINEGAQGRRPSSRADALRLQNTKEIPKSISPSDSVFVCSNIVRLTC